MADTYIINASNQTVTGTAAGEIFEFDSSLKNGTFTNVVINAAGGKDTIKAGTQSATRQTIDAVVTGLNPSSRLDFGETYGDNFFYFATQPDGIHITNENGAYKFKLLGMKDTSICTGDTKNMFMALQQTTKWDDYLMGGTALADTLTVNHARCKATGRGGDDLITSYGNFNLLEGSEGNDVVINMGNNGILRGDNGDDILSCGGSNNVLQGGDGNDVLIFGNTNKTVNGDAGNDTFKVYSYAADGSNNTLTGGGGNDTYIISTGLVGVDVSRAETSPYNQSNSDTVNVTITDAKAGDSYYLRDFGINDINVSTTADGVVISSASGRINVTMKNCDWNAVKDNLITFDTAQEYLKRCTLEYAVAETLARLIPPDGISVSGNRLDVSADFVGNLIMSSASANYTNNQVVTINATRNPQIGMQIVGNANSNKVYAGRGGNVLWGGQDNVTDLLFGNAGEDIFLVGKNDGNDKVFNAAHNDVINLYDVRLDDIASAGVDANTIALSLKSGNVILVKTNDIFSSPKFQLADGSAYRYNRTSNSWQGA